MASIHDVLAFLALAISATLLQGCDKDWCEGLKGTQTDVCKECVETADKLPMGKDTAKGNCKAAAEKTPALFEEAAQVEKRMSKPAANSVTDVSSQTPSQQSGAAVQLQKSAAVVTSHGGARARRKFQEHLEATEEGDKA